MTLTVTRDLPPVSTLLFDLDGTLLDIDMPAFLKAYFSLAGRRFVSPSELPRITPALAAAARKMAAYRAGTHTLDRVFLEAFSRAIKRPPIEVRGVFTAFHRAEFEQLRRLTAPRPAARPLLEMALELGYELAIATNPVFFLEAIRARIRWAGLDGFPFTLVTCAEIMRCAKPHRRIFRPVPEAPRPTRRRVPHDRGRPGAWIFPPGFWASARGSSSRNPRNPCRSPAPTSGARSKNSPAGSTPGDRRAAVAQPHAGPVQDGGLPASLPALIPGGAGFDAGDRRCLHGRGMGPPHAGLHPPEHASKPDA